MQPDLLTSKQGDERREWEVIPGWSWIDMEPDEVMMGSGSRASGLNGPCWPEILEQGHGRRSSHQMRPVASRRSIRGHKDPSAEQEDEALHGGESWGGGRLTLRAGSCGSGTHAGGRVARLRGLLRRGRRTVTSGPGARRCCAAAAATTAAREMRAHRQRQGTPALRWTTLGRADPEAGPSPGAGGARGGASGCGQLQVARTPASGAGWTRRWRRI